ncbi:MAG: hypothetical protein AAF267_24135 [Deinococcota bacterium]
MSRASIPAKVAHLIQWHEARREGNLLGYEGLLVEGCKRPYHLDVTLQGQWNLWHYDNNDQPKIIGKGSEGDVEQGKLVATITAANKIPELRKHLEPDEPEIEIPIEPISPAHRTLRMYGAVTALILWLVWGLYWLIRSRPRVGILAVIVLIFGFWVAHVVINWLTIQNQKREKLVKQGAAQAIIQASAQAQEQHKSPAKVSKG